MTKALVFNSYGGPDVLEVVDQTPAAPAPGAVRVEVHAAGAQPFDCLFRSGQARQWIPARFPQRLGNEFAGIVDAVGPGVTDWQIGEEVLGWAMLASQAKHVIAGEADMVRKPVGLPWEHAGVISASGQTAATAIRLLGVGAGETILIHAAAGGVGGFAVQLAVASGATVIGTASPRNHDYLRRLGAIPVAYGDGLADRVRELAPDGIQAALDGSGSVDALTASIELGIESQRIGTVAFQPAAAQLGVQRLSTERSAAQLRELTDLYLHGKLQIEIAGSAPLEDAERIHAMIETGHTRGKYVLIP